MRGVAAICVVLLLSSCSQRSGRTTFVFGAITTGLGVAAGVGAEVAGKPEEGPGPQIVLIPGSIVLLAVGVIAMISGLTRSNDPMRF